MTTRPPRFIVPLGGVNTFCTFRDGELIPENPLPQVGYEGHATDPDFGWVAWVADGGKSIGRAHLDAVEGEGGFAPLVMPAGYTAGCLLFHRQVLFVGGDCGKEVLGSFDLAAPVPKWRPLEVPEQFRQYGKKIDDLLLDGDRLIAVDDIVSPKYLLRYDVTEPRSPRPIDVRDIPWHSSYETIHSAALGTDWVALLSTTANHGWWGVHVALLDRADLRERGAMTATQKGSPRRDETSEARDWRRLAFHGNTLLVAAGMDGVGVLNLGAVRKSVVRRVIEAARGTRDSGAGGREFGRRCLSALEYQTLPVRHLGYPVTRVVPVPGTSHYLAVFDTEPGLDTTVMTLP